MGVLGFPPGIISGRRPRAWVSPSSLKLSLQSGLAACQVNFVEPLGKYLDRLSARQSSRRRSAIRKRRTRTTKLAARHISAVNLEDALRWNFVVSLVASFVAASRSRCVTIRPVVSSLFDPAKRSAAGGVTNLKLSLWSGFAGHGRYFGKVWNLEGRGLSRPLAGSIFRTSRLSA